MRTNRFEGGIPSVLKVIGIGMALYIGFYIGTKIAKKLKIDTKGEVKKYTGVGISAKKMAHEHYGSQEMILG